MRVTYTTTTLNPTNTHTSPTEVHEEPVSAALMRTGSIAPVVAANVLSHALPNP